MTGTRKPKSCLARWSASPGVRTCEESGVGDPVVSVHGVVAQVSALQVAVIGAEHERHRTQVPRCRLSSLDQEWENQGPSKTKTGNRSKTTAMTSKTGIPATLFSGSGVLILLLCTKSFSGTLGFTASVKSRISEELTRFQ